MDCVSIVSRLSSVNCQSLVHSQLYCFPLAIVTRLKALISAQHCAGHCGPGTPLLLYTWIVTSFLTPSLAFLDCYQDSVTNQLYEHHHCENIMNINCLNCQFQIVTKSVHILAIVSHFISGLVVHVGWRPHCPWERCSQLWSSVVTCIVHFLSAGSMFSSAVVRGRFVSWTTVSSSDLSFSIIIVFSLTYCAWSSCPFCWRLGIVTWKVSIPFVAL